MIFKKIEKAAQDHNMSITMLEIKCGFGNGTICKWKKSSPTIKNLQKVADCLNVPITELLEHDEAE